MKQIDLAYRTLFAELNQRAFDGSFETAYSLTGNFVKIPVKGREYWYFNDPDERPVRRYVGPVDDAEITKRVNEFRTIKDDIRARRKIVATLTREVGLTPPERMTGDVVEAMEQAGLFRLRAVLVGTVAYQTYSAQLGVRLPGAAMQTGDADFAQFHSISVGVDDTMQPILDVLRGLDPTFRPVPHLADGRQSTQYANDAKYKVEFLTPNTGSNDYSDKPAAMPALGGAAAQPLRYLDFLIHEPVRSTMLHKSGIPVIVPSPQRYAVHKLIVAQDRQPDAEGQAKRDKDIMQSRSLFEAMAITRRQDELAEAFHEAWIRGPHWRTGIAAGLKLLSKDQRGQMVETLKQGLVEIGEPADILASITP